MLENKQLLPFINCERAHNGETLMPKYVIAAGSCHPHGRAFLSEARTAIANVSNMMIEGESAILKNPSCGMTINRLFFNCAFAIFTPLEPLIFYRELKAIEHKLGRIRSYKNAPRTIDLDVLLSFDLSYNSPTFSVPHKEFYTRDFFVSCAMKAITCAGWPMPPNLMRARAAKSYLAPCS